MFRGKGIQRCNIDYRHSEREPFIQLKIINIVGARPNLPKVAPLMREMQRHPDKIAPILVHIGQHFDEACYQLASRKADAAQISERSAT